MTDVFGHVTTPTSKTAIAPLVLEAQTKEFHTTSRKLFVGLGGSIARLIGA